jgi:protein SCO1/2
VGAGAGQGGSTLRPVPPGPAEKRRNDPKMRRNLGILGAVVVALGVGLGVVLPFGASDEGRLELNAPPVDPPRFAPATAGQGVDGDEIRLPAGDGRPAVVTFLFTECPDVCPLIANTIRTALDQIGSEAKRIDVVAITVDPEDDTPRAVRSFLGRHGLTGRMDNLIGTRAELRPVWAAWGIAPQPEDSGPAPGHEGHEAEESLHSAPVILVDEDGRQVGKYAPGIPFSARELADDMRRLL